MKQRPTSLLRAFSLIELLVVVGIFAFISIIILANHGKFNSKVLLDSLAYNAALSVRQAQVYGISVRANAAVPGQFQIGYGMHLQKSTPAQYILFADLNKNQKYDGTPTDAIVETYSIGQGHSIKSFCAYTTSASNCSDDASAPITFLDISFLRPNPDAMFATDKIGTTYSRAAFTLSSANGDTRTVSVATTGEVSVTGADATACTPSNICYLGNVVNSCTGATVSNCNGYGCTSGACNACVPSNICSGSNVVNSCTGALVQTCQYGCTNGSCSACVPNGTFSCSGNNVLNSCGAVTQTCVSPQTCSNGACSCTPNGTYSCDDGFSYYNSCGTFMKTCANGCTGTYPGCIPAGGGGGGCFAPEIPVTMADGTTKPIVEVRVGDRVLGQDEFTGTKTENTVERILVHEGDYDTLRINGDLVVTPNHPMGVLRYGSPEPWERLIVTPNNEMVALPDGFYERWTRAENLRVGDVLVSIDGFAPVTSIEPGATLPAVYNLTTLPTHTYYAGGFLVHNVNQK